MIGRLFSSALLFCAACLLIYLGVSLLAGIWWILAIIFAIVAIIGFFVRIRRNRRRW